MNNASEQTKLYLCLGLNFGFTQEDISTLMPEMVDFSKHIMMRKRHKRQKNTQTAYIWSKTEELLKKFLTKNGILSKTKTSLIHYNVDKQSPQKKDLVKDAIRKLANDCKDKKVSQPIIFKRFRKTGASLIHQNFQNLPHLKDLYLAHNTMGVSQYYSPGYWDLLYDAQKWMGQYLNLHEEKSVDEEKSLDILGQDAIKDMPNLVVGGKKKFVPSNLLQGD